MVKLFDKILFATFKIILVAIQFTVWFLIVGLVSKVAGIIVGVLSAFCLMAFMNVKRNARV